MRRLGLIALLAMLGASLAGAASQQAWEDCRQKQDLDRQMRGCKQALNDRRESADNRAVAHMNLANAYTDKGDYDNALPEYEKALRLRPNYGLAYYNRGHMRWMRRQYDEALVDFNQAI